ncbi:MAG: hypothetical protein M3Y30_15820 [Gemmatimonadota bacterium]|nr:hypothetical protein [Gemmatimonadota bacterium]
MSSKHISLLVCALVALATSAGAQFTAVVVPPRVKAKVDTTVTKDSVRRATVALAARVTDMRKWVDSAAGVSIPAGDSTMSVKNSAAAAAPPMKDSVVMSHNARVRADSAASIATVEVHDSAGLKASDSAKVVPPTSSRNASRDSLRDTKRFASGAPAPNTASLLPLLALAGASTLLAGAALRR